MEQNVRYFFNLPADLAEKESTKCLDLSHNYYIIVPLDAEGIERLYRYDIYFNGEIRSDMAVLVFHEDVFYYMEPRLFDFINVECGLLINMYEEETLENDQLDKAIAIVEVVMNNSDDDVVIDFAKKVLELLRLAKQHGAIMGFYF